MAQFYTLEEAARVLGMGPEDLKTKAQHREVRAFLDGGTWRFRVADVDELARRRGLGSDAELQLHDFEVPASHAGSGSKDDLDLSEFQMGAAKPAVGEPTSEHSHSFGTGRTTDQDILLDDLSLPPNPVTGSSSVIIGMENAGKLPSDSDVRLVPDNVKGASDSDVRLAPSSKFKTPSDSDVTLIADDTGAHPTFGHGSSDTSVRKSPVGSSAEVAAHHAESDSDFELTPSSVIDALQPDSGSDFELNALEGSDEFESTPLVKAGSDSDVTAAEPGLSGINLSRPSDSGINLQMASGLNLGQSSSIELAPLSGDEIPSPPKKKPAPAPAAKGKKSLSETPPPGVAKGDKDIFDDTDFEVDALASDGESDDKTQQIEAASDFELEGTDTGSEVFAIDEDDVDQNAATSVGAVDLGEDEGDSGEFASEGGSGEMAGSSAWDVESETPSGSTGRAPATMLAPSGPSAEWGGLWVGFLGAATFFMLMLAFVGMDLVRNMYDIANDTPASGMVRFLGGFIGGS